MNKPIVIVICGPTASGKTAISIELAKKIDGQIISADSMQIYKDMNIGSAKVTPEEMEGIKHYLVDEISPNTRYSVSDYKKSAKKAIKEILGQNKIPIIVGGTGLYIDSLIYEIDYQDMPYEEEYREELKRQIKQNGLESLYEKAKEIDEQAVEKISKNDEKRIMRILEIYHQTGKTKTQLEIESRKNEIPYDYRVFALTMNRQALYERINQRVDIMIEKGLVQEVEQLLKKYPEFPTAMQAIGYKEVKQYFDGILTKEEMIEKIKQETRRYAKRQLTWFRKNKDTIWLDVTEGIQFNINKILEEINGETRNKTTIN